MASHVCCLFARAYEAGVDSQFDGAHRHRAVEVSLRLAVSGGEVVGGAGGAAQAVDGRQDAAEHPEGEQQDDEEGVAGDGGVGGRRRRAAHLAQLCDGGREAGVEVERVAQVKARLVPLAPCRQDLTEGEVLQPRPAARPRRPAAAAPCRLQRAARQQQRVVQVAQVEQDARQAEQRLRVARRQRQRLAETVDGEARVAADTVEVTYLVVHLRRLRMLQRHADKAVIPLHHATISGVQLYINDTLDNRFLNIQEQREPATWRAYVQNLY